MKIEISKHNNKWGYTIFEINGEVASSNFGYKTIEEAKKAAWEEKVNIIKGRCINI